MISYRVTSFIPNHSTLRILAKDDKQSFYYMFDSVSYFSGALQWTGTAFVEGDPDECLHVVKKNYPLFEGIVPDEKLKQHFTLFESTTPENQRVLIVSVLMFTKELEA
jgi:hypothetical protein